MWLLTIVEAISKCLNKWPATANAHTQWMRTSSLVNSCSPCNQINLISSSFLLYQWHVNNSPGLTLFLVPSMRWPAWNVLAINKLPRFLGSLSLSLNYLERDIYVGREQRNNNKQVPGREWTLCVSITQASRKISVNSQAGRKSFMFLSPCRPGISEANTHQMRRVREKPVIRESVARWGERFSI